MFRRSQPGFTLAELLIALAILGIIATFTIPKVISAQANGQYNAQAKEVTGIISASYQTYILNNTNSSNTTFGLLTPYLNYVSVDTSSDIDDIPGFSTQTCSSSAPCLRLHNGSVLKYSTGGSFGGTGSTNVLVFYYDPDGVYGGSTSGKSKSIKLFLYYNGKITSAAQLSTSVSSSNDGMPPGFSDPTWFQW